MVVVFGIQMLFELKFLNVKPDPRHLITVKTSNTTMKIITTMTTIMATI